MSQRKDRENSSRDKGDPYTVDAKVLEAVNFWRCREKNGIHIHDLILFGSSGRGTASPHSDIDIAIVSTDFVSKNIFERALMTKDAELQTVRKFRVALDVITLTPEEYRDPASLIAGTIRKGIAVPVPSSA